MLSSAELSRYARQLTLSEVGLDGQERLRAARVLVIGAGGLGSPAALYLAAAGVGVIGIVDDDDVELSNLHRQILHSTDDLGREKTASAAASITRLNPHVEVHSHHDRLQPAHAASLIAQYDLVVDGSDNYATRYAVNDACATLGKRWVYGSVERFSGQVSVFGDPGGPCYRCLFPEPPTAGSTANCEEIGVLGAIPGTIGSFQAVEALKCILDLGRPLVGRMLLIDFSSAEVRTIQVQRRADCRSCSLQADHAVHGSLAAAPATLDSTDIEPTELASRLTEKAVQLLDVREPWEWSLARIGQPHLLAMNALSTELDSLDRSRELIVYCHHGVRSHLAAEWLRAQGFRARNLAGGIDRWSREIDPSVPRY